MAASSLYWFRQLDNELGEVFGRVLNVLPHFWLSLSGRLLKASREGISKASGL